jgi:asparagine synthetase B (glutamine-hydrolysing)
MLVGLCCSAAFDARAQVSPGPLARAHADLDGNLGFGNRRLSIIDRSGGQQPISNEDQTIIVVYNGEIYNYEQLKESLEQKGHSLTSSDTEVLSCMKNMARR